MMPDRPYEEILAAMQECAEMGDTEIAHMKADRLLIEVALCSHLISSERYAIVKMWESVNKWYA